MPQASPFNRAAIVDQRTCRLLETYRPAVRTAHSEEQGLDKATVLELLESQLLSRHVDLMARRLRAVGEAFYTIGSAGHEGNAVVGRLTDKRDPAFLHYRSGALVAERARQSGNFDFVRDTLLSLAASTDDPSSGGRHKVWGSRELGIIPQTSTIGSHLPKAVGTAIALGRSRRLRLENGAAKDAIVLCSFGDASTHHSTAHGAFNAAAFAVHQGLPVPILFVCEDNGLGISVPTPKNWIESSFGNRPGIRYFYADGCDLGAAYRVTQNAVGYCRRQRRPAFLHLRVVRLLGHAGSDMEAAYRTLEEIERTEAQDPLLNTLMLAIDRGFASAEELRAQYERLRWQVESTAASASIRPKLASAAEILRPLAPLQPNRLRARVAQTARGAQSGAGERQTLATQLNRGLIELMETYPQAVVFGEDVAQKGGVYHVTRGLLKRFGPARVFNSLLDEQSILGLAQGFASVGLLPIPEIQYLAYLHNAIDQLRGEACSLQFFSNGQYRNPMVVRVASFGYQRGFGGHFHNDNSTAALREIPALIVATPSRGDDAICMLRTLAAAAMLDGRVSAFLEPIALYNTRDLYQPGDGQWLTQHPDATQHIAVGEGRVYHQGATDVAIVTYANGVHMSLQAARQLADAHGIHCRVVDLRWLSPLNETLLCESASACDAVVFVDEGRRSGGVAEAAMAIIAESLHPCPRLARVTGLDTYIPLGAAAQLVLPSVGQVVDAVLRTLRLSG